MLDVYRKEASEKTVCASASFSSYVSHTHEKEK
jgi:hypothetical protein